MFSLAFGRKHLPKLKKFPAEYIYEPWKAPRSVQQAAGCIIGKDYPQPIVQHEAISKKNIQRMKMAYAKRSTVSADSPTKTQGDAESLECSNVKCNLNVTKECLFYFPTSQVGSARTQRSQK